MSALASEGRWMSSLVLQRTEPKSGRVLFARMAQTQQGRTQEASRDAQAHHVTQDMGSPV